MAEAEECKHGMVPEFCADCTGKGGVERGVPDATISARYDGQCGWCAKHINVGEPIHRVEGVWVCDDHVSRFVVRE